jgi:hypothetical protein
VSKTAIGLRAQKGGAVAVGVSVAADGPRLLFSRFLPTSTEGDRLSHEPYRVAFEMADSAARAEAVAEGRGRQRTLAAEGLEGLDHKPDAAALLVNRAGWITDLLDYALSWPDHVPIAETMAVRDALRFAVGKCGLELVELDEKSLPDQAARGLGLSAAEIDAQLKAFAPAAGKPWRKEQKLAALAAWIAAASRGA